VNAQPSGLTFENVVRSVALQFGHVPTADEVEWVLWERTGFPSFFMGDPARECAEQVFRHYQEAHDA
jgi:Flp pilus assembly protein CpaB